VKAVVDKVAPTWWRYCKNPRELLAARRELAERILRVKGGAD
jgi:hypothetical protein